MLHVDVSATRGLLEAKKIADLADLYYMPFAAQASRVAATWHVPRP